MIADLEPYPAYKDSGVEWLGRVPEAWSVLPLGAGFRSALQRNTGMSERTVLSLSYGQIVVKPEDKLHGLVPESFETYQRVAPGDIIVRTTDLQNDQTSLRVGAVRTKGIITSAYLRLIARENVRPDFGYLLLHAYDVMKVIYGYGSGLRQTLDFGQVKRIPVALPSVEEQSAIVSFLGYVDSRIQRFIAAKERLVELLDEEERATILSAVTRGLDADAVFQPSGIDWLEEVPEHWRRSRLKNVVSMKAGKGITSDSINEEDRFPVYGGNGLRGYTSDFTHEGDRILIGRQGALCGNVHLVGGRFWATEHAIVVEVGDRCDARWMSLLFVAMDLNQYSEAAAQPGLSTDRIRNLEIPVPPLAEQEQIAGWVDRITAEAGEVRTKASRQIALLREFRSRLVSDVVTGKLDVREVAAKLPDDPDADDPALEERLEEVAAK
jgi:type I restriction enzyme, S subunit